MVLTGRQIVAHESLTRTQVRRACVRSGADGLSLLMSFNKAGMCAQSLRAGGQSREAAWDMSHGA